MANTSIYGTGFGGDGADQRDESTETWTSTPTKPAETGTPWALYLLLGLGALWLYLKKR